MSSNESFETPIVDPDTAAAIARLEQGGFIVTIVHRCPAEQCGWCPPVGFSRAA